ncbi:high nitrogen upregulated cytochrome P450 monooxygenase 1 [Trametopsis cervina]|nr:high nitrogen upregulated cytochrome P450 monooxygenase 1 [Trametopsis cervina]
MTTLLASPTWPASLPILVTSFTVYLIFKRYEPERVAVASFLLAGVPAGVVYIVRAHFTTFLGAVLTTFISFWSLIVAFTIAYRLSPLHPLAKYPGPLLCKISNGWIAFVASRGKAHIYVNELHKKYNSDIIRTGPNEVSVTNEGIASAVLGPKGLPRGPYYQTRIHEAGTSLDGLRDQALHTVRRRPWARGMNTTSMKYYEELVKSTVTDLTTAFRQREGEVVDISQWMTFFGFDFMGHMAFTYDYKMLKNGYDIHKLNHLIEQALSEAAWISHLPWSLPFLSYLPGATKSWDEMKVVGEATVEARVAAGSKEKDLFYHLIDEEGLEPVRPSLELCATDGQLAVIAGSDTAATALSHLWYFLLTQPKYLTRLRDEVDKAYPHGADPIADLTNQANMPYLNACINEALRLYPPVLTGLQRRVEEGSGGKMVGPYFIPEGTQVSPWGYAVHRDPQHYSPIPDAFWPERWLVQDNYTLPTGDTISKDAVVTNRDVFISFSLGPMVCVGKNVAMMEMRAVMCAVLHQYDVVVADRSRFDSYENEICEIFTTKRGTLPVYLKPRGV